MAKINILKIALVIIPSLAWIYFLYYINQDNQIENIEWFEVASASAISVWFVIVMFINFKYEIVDKWEQTIIFVGLSLMFFAELHNFLDEFVVIEQALLVSFLENMVMIIGIVVMTFGIYRWIALYEKEVALLKNQQTELIQEVYKDSLTGLYNRRYLKEVLCKEITTTIMERRKCFVLVMDIDDFKQHNDKYGHFEGDKVIKKCGSIILQSLRPHDVVIRFGGEEFVAVIYGQRDIAEQVAMRVLSKFNSHVFKIGSERIKKSLSIGVAIVNNKYSLKDAIGLADIAMYQVKKSGKNNMLFAEQES